MGFWLIGSALLRRQILRKGKQFDADRIGFQFADRPDYTTTARSTDGDNWSDKHRRNGTARDHVL